MGVEKAMLVAPNGRTLAAIVATAMHEAGLAVLVAGPGHVLPELPHIEDCRDDSGPLAAIAAGLAHARPAGIVAIPCDLPWIDSTTIQRLLTPTDALATAFVDDDDPKSPGRPLPARFASAALVTILDQIAHGHFAVRDALARLPLARVPLRASEAQCLDDVDTLDAWEAFVRSVGRDH